MTRKTRLRIGYILSLSLLSLVLFVPMIIALTNKTPIEPKPEFSFSLETTKKDSVGKEWDITTKVLKNGFNLDESKSFWKITNVVGGSGVDNELTTPIINADGEVTTSIEFINPGITILYWEVFSLDDNNDTFVPIQENKNLLYDLPRPPSVLINSIEFDNAALNNVKVELTYDLGVPSNQVISEPILSNSLNPETTQVVPGRNVIILDHPIGIGGTVVYDVDFVWNDGSNDIIENVQSQPFSLITEDYRDLNLVWTSRLIYDKVEYTLTSSRTSQMNFSFQWTIRNHQKYKLFSHRTCRNLQTNNSCKIFLNTTEHKITTTALFDIESLYHEINTTSGAIWIYGDEGKVLAIGTMAEYDNDQNVITKTFDELYDVNKTIATIVLVVIALGIPFIVMIVKVIKVKKGI